MCSVDLQKLYGMHNICYVDRLKLCNLKLLELRRMHTNLHADTQPAYIRSAIVAERIYAGYVSAWLISLCCIKF